MKWTIILLTFSVTLLSPLSAFTSNSKIDFVDSTTGMEFVFIKGGSYMMGDIYGSDKYAKPTHKVSVKDFYFGKYEVTFEQYDKFCEMTKRKKPSDEGWGRGNRPGARRYLPRRDGSGRPLSARDRDGAHRSSSA